ncbi:MAG: hypothetical protein V1779_01665 [bacterium]
MKNKSYFLIFIFISQLFLSCTEQYHNKTNDKNQLKLNVNNKRKLTLREMKNIAFQINKEKYSTKEDKDSFFLIDMDSFKLESNKNKFDYRNLPVGKWIFLITVNEECGNFWNDKFQIFVCSEPAMPTEYNYISVTNNGSHYILRGFRKSEFKELVINEIGELNKIQDYQRLSIFFVKTVLNDHYSSLYLIDSNFYQNYKEKYPEIEKPKLSFYNSKNYFTFTTLEPEINWTIKYTFIFNKGVFESIVSDTLRFGEQKEWM